MFGDGGCGVSFSGTGGIDAPIVTPDADIQLIADAMAGDAPAAKVTIGRSVSGLGGSGLVLQNNLGDDLSISANGTFTFATAVNPCGAYSVTVRKLPTAPAQTFVATSCSGSALTNVTNVTVTCTTTSFTVGGTVSEVASGGMFHVSAKKQPSNATQACVVSGGSGIVGSNKVSSVVVNCADNAFVFGGTISGLAGTLVLQDNGGNDLSLTTNGSFAFSEPLMRGSPYAVAIKSQPTAPIQTCAVTAGTGNVAAANVTGVSVVCTTNKFGV